MDRAIPIPQDAFAKTAVGDVIQLTGQTVPRALWKCWFRVEARDGDRIALSRPYVDRAMTLPFQWQGSQRGSALALERRSRKHAHVA